jgi:MSHA biogenesis protein MshQ
MTVDNSSVGTDLPDFPLFVRITGSRIDYAVTQDGGQDVRFVLESTGEILDHEIERWEDDGNSVVWIRLPSLPDSGDPEPTVWMYYGNPGVSDGQDADGVWDDDFESVHHLEDLTDSSGNGHDGVTTSAPNHVNAQIGRGGDFNGSNDHVEIPPENDFDFTNALTVEAWLRVDNFDSDWQAFVTKGDGTWRMQRNFDSDEVVFGSDSNTTANANLAGSISVDDNGWHYVVIAYGGNTKRIYVDGTADGSAGFNGPLRTDSEPVYIAANSEYPERNFDGRIDEVRISRVERLPAWIETQNRSMRDQLVDFGDEESCP